MATERIGCSPLASSVSPGGGSQAQINAPTVTSVSANNGATDGGITVTVIGTNFVVGGTQVKFASDDATSESVSSSTTMTCVVPAHAAGAVNVSATTTGGTGTLTNGFTYYGVPTVASCSPSTGGPGSVVIAGTNFVAGATVTFGGDSATNVVVNSNLSITCTAPAHADGAVDVVVTTGSGAGTGTNAYTYSNSEPTDPGSGYLFHKTATIDAIYAGTSTDIRYLDQQGVNQAGNSGPAWWETNAWSGPQTLGTRPYVGYLSPGRRGAGTVSFTVFYASTTGGNQNRHVATRPVSGFGSYTAGAAVVMQCYMRWSSSWNGFNGSAGHKLFQWYVAGGGSHSQVSMTSINGSVYRFRPNIAGADCSGSACPFPAYNLPNIDDNAWHRITVLSHPSNMLRVWFDGVKVVDISAAALSEGTPPGGDKAWTTQADVDRLPNLGSAALVLLGETANDVTDAFDLGVDDLKVWLP